MILPAEHYTIAFALMLITGFAGMRIMQPLHDVARMMFSAGVMFITGAAYLGIINNFFLSK